MVPADRSARHHDRGDAVSRLTIDVTYAGSAGTEGAYPSWSLPEIALAGRSNVGKSSLLNGLAGRRGLARVSQTPGRTQRVHFFSCSTPRGKFALVDLPGYGYARAPRADRERWGEAVERYLLGRENLRALVLLCDVRRDLADEERLLEDLVDRRELAMIRVATKVDKLGRADRERCLRGLGEGWIPFSSKTLEGRDELLDALVAVAAG